jgi:type VI secretion system protein ImpH
MGAARRPQAAALTIMSTPTDATQVAPDAQRALEQPYLRALLADDPNGVRFVQLVRLLEQLAPERTAVGGSGDPARELVRFAVPPTMAFPASEVQTLDLAPKDESRPSRVAVNFLGLTGPQGVLPMLYTQQVADRLRARDGAMAEFLDLFHHRLLSLHFRAWAKYRPLDRLPAAPTATDEMPPPADRVAHHLLDLVGLGTPGLFGRLDVPDDAAAYYAGLLAPVQRSALALEQLIGDHFDVPVEVVQFIGGWYPLDAVDRTAVGEERENATQLGRGAVAGDEIWDQQSCVRIRLGPLSRVQYERFLPTGPDYRALESLVRFFTDDRYALEVQLVLSRHDVPPTILGDDSSLPLMWGTWLASARRPSDRDDTVLPLTAGSAS